MNSIDELNNLLSGQSRVVVVSERDVDLRPAAEPNRLFLFKLQEGSLAAGGRGGGFGERRVTAVSIYRLQDGGCERTFQAEDEARISAFEIPYYVARVPITLADGTEAMGYGVVEPGLVAELVSKAAALSPP